MYQRDERCVWSGTHTASLNLSSLGYRNLSTHFQCTGTLLCFGICVGRNSLLPHAKCRRGTIISSTQTTMKKWRGEKRGKVSVFQTRDLERRRGLDLAFLGRYVLQRVGCFNLYVVQYSGTQIFGVLLACSAARRLPW